MAICSAENRYGQSVKIWFDPEADFLEVVFLEAPGFMRETENDAILERADSEGNILGFSAINVSKLARESTLCPVDLE